MSRSPSLLIAGCGDIGSRLALQMLAQGWTVHGMRRDISRLPAGVLPVAADLHGDQCPPRAGSIVRPVTAHGGWRRRL